MRKRTRRVVTGHTDDGRAVVKIDDAPEASVFAEGRVRFTKLWTTDRSPADNNDAFDGGMRETGLTCPGGSVLRIVDIAPGFRSPLHRTLSVDYGLVLEGEVDLELDDGALAHLTAGDVVVQRGTIHAWINNSDQWVRLAFILICAEPVRVGDNSLKPIGG